MHLFSKVIFFILRQIYQILFQLHFVLVFKELTKAQKHPNILYIFLCRICQILQKQELFVCFELKCSRTLDILTLLYEGYFKKVLKLMKLQVIWKRKRKTSLLYNMGVSVRIIPRKIQKRDFVLILLRRNSKACFIGGHQYFVV